MFDVVWMFGTKLVHVCEGAMRYPVGWVQDCVVWMFGTKFVQVCEGAVRYPVGWVQDYDLVVCYGFYE